MYSDESMIYNFNTDKDNMLQVTRGIGFKEVIKYINMGMVLDIIQPVNSDK